MAEIKCDYCGKVHYRRPSRTWKQNYCCNDCYQIGRLLESKIDIGNEYAEIIINKQGTVLNVKIDKEDIDKVKQYRWCARYDKTIDGYYIEAWERGKNRKRLKLHRLVMDCPVGLEVDHINRDTLDNRKENLRNVTPLENKQNKGFYKNNKSGYKYIYFDNNKNMYMIQRRKNNKQVLIGSSKTLQEAINIRDNFLKKESEE